MAGSWWSFNVSSTGSQHFSEGLSASAHRRNLFDNTPLLISFSSCLTSQINYSHSDCCLRVHLKGNINQVCMLQMWQFNMFRESWANSQKFVDEMLFITVVTICSKAYILGGPNCIGDGCALMCMSVMMWTLLVLVGLFWVKLLEIVFSHKFHKCFHVLNIVWACSKPWLWKLNSFG